MKAVDILKPVCKGLVCGVVLAAFTKPFELSIKVSSKPSSCDSKEEG